MSPNGHAFSLLDLVPDGASCLAFVGAARNTGKTTTLNRTLDELADRDLPAGLLSIGVDGERADAFSGAPKPRIVVRPGDLVATAEDALASSSCRAEVLDLVGITSALGELAIARITREGTVLLAGVRFRSDLPGIRQRLRDAGAAIVLMDGAFDRRTAVPRSISDGLVLSTGAVVGQGVEEVARRTADGVSLLRLPAVPPDLRHALDSIPGPAIGRDGALRPLPSPSLLVTPDAVARAWQPGDDLVWVPGALGPTLVEHLLALPGSGLTIVVRDPSSIIAPDGLLKRLRRRADLRVLEAVNLIAVSANPCHPDGDRLDGPALLDALHNAIPDLPILDPVSGRFRAPIPTPALPSPTEAAP